MPVSEAFDILKLPQSSSLSEINSRFKSMLNDLQRKLASKPDQLVAEADNLYAAYRTAYMHKGGDEDNMLPLTLTGPDAMLNIFGINEVPHQSLKVQMQSAVQYKDGQLVKKESTKTESFINKDGKRETRVYENGRLIKHTIDGKNMLK